MTEAMKRMIIDCDPGHDDAIALLLAHRHAQVAGITTVCGNVPLAATTANALLVTALLDVDTPVHAGAARPLVGEPQHAPHVHGESGLGDVTRMAHDKVAAGDDGVGFLLDAAAPDVWVVALGPLTNVALAIERDPDWVKRIAGIALMGGSTDVGNVTRVAEFNVYADAEAAERVFRSGADITMCGLNLTHQVMTTDAVVERLRGAGTAVASFAAQVFDDLHGRIADPDRLPGSGAARSLRGAGGDAPGADRNRAARGERRARRHADPRHDGRRSAPRPAGRSRHGQGRVPDRCGAGAAGGHGVARSGAGTELMPPDRGLPHRHRVEPVSERSVRSPLSQVVG